MVPPAGYEPRRVKTLPSSFTSGVSPSTKQAPWSRMHSALVISGIAQVGAASRPAIGTAAEARLTPSEATRVTAGESAPGVRVRVKLPSSATSADWPPEVTVSAAPSRVSVTVPAMVTEPSSAGVTAWPSAGEVSVSTGASES